MRAIALLVAVALFVNVGCEKKPPEATRESEKSPAAQSHSAGDGHDQGGTDDHDHNAHDDTADDGHNRGAADAHDDGESHNHTEHELGPTTIGGYSVRAVLHGEIVAGKEIHVDVFITDSESKISAVRAWIGAESGKGALKARVTINKSGAHNHVEAPSPLPADAKLCIELELSGGEKIVGSLSPQK